MSKRSERKEAIEYLISKSDDLNHLKFQIDRLEDKVNNSFKSANFDRMTKGTDYKKQLNVLKDEYKTKYNIVKIQAARKVWEKELKMKQAKRYDDMEARNKENDVSIYDSESIKNLVSSKVTTIDLDMTKNEKESEIVENIIDTLEMSKHNR